MAELTFKSPGVSTKEIDLSGPTSISPTGVPAGIIGTANQGPAFVPVTVATFADFMTYFGKTDGEKFGPLAMYEWMKNANAGTYLRVLGVGDGKKRLSAASTNADASAIPAGGVKNAGFIAGDRQVNKATGLVGVNKYAYNGAGVGNLGRTYLLGAFMSESAGSSYLSDAGIQTAGSAKAAPILRGVLMAASGVMLSLSGNYCGGIASTASLNSLPDFGVASTSGGASIGSIYNGTYASHDKSYNFVMLLNGHKSTGQHSNTLTASLNPGRSNYISEVFNTDPSKLQQAGHVLYSYYDVFTAQAVITGSGLIPKVITPSGSKEDAVFMVTSSLDRNAGSTAIPNLENFSDRFQHAFSPAVISQKIGGKNKDLFTVHMLDAGAFTNTNVKVSIENIRKSKVDGDYGVFDLLVRKFADGDESVAIVETGETFRGLSLNPSSDNYIARRIGTINKFYDFDKSPASQKIVVDGIHPNMSRYIRVEMALEVDSGDITKTALPVGFRGPYHLVTSGSGITMDFQHPLATSAGVAAGGIFTRGSVTNPGNQIVEPPVPYRTSISDGTGGKKKPNSSYYWGLQTTQVDVTTTTNSSRIFNDGISGFTRYYPKFATGQQALWVGANNGTIDSDGTVYDSDRFNNNLFSLEQIQIHTKSTSDIVDAREWGFAKYRRNNELTGRPLFPKKDGTTDTGRFLNVAKDFGDIASFKYLKFTMPVQGGFDGVNVFDKDKAKLTDNAAKREMSDENQGEVNGPTVGAYLKALHIMAEKSDVDIQLLAVPGIRETKITDDAIAKTESRFDALYIMDMEERDVSNNVVTSSIQEISVTNTIEDLRGRALDTSFAATYFPDTIIPDPVTQTNVRVPPSVSVLGALSLNDAVAFPWFAPAGFTRGSLANVFDTTVNFNRANLDSLYESDINPITQFPDKKEHVIFGQKTLQAAASSLDRVNVRRLLIDVRRKVRNIADTFIFEPNRADTLARFSAAVNPVLAQVQAQQGVERYRVIIDTTTTTQADIENNTVRGKIFMQPTRAVEFIALDFVVTNNGTEI